MLMNSPCSLPERKQLHSSPLSNLFACSPFFPFFSGNEYKKQIIHTGSGWDLRHWWVVSIVFLPFYSVFARQNGLLAFQDPRLWIFHCPEGPTKMMRTCCLLGWWHLKPLPFAFINKSMYSDHNNNRVGEGKKTRDIATTRKNNNNNKKK